MQWLSLINDYNRLVITFVGNNLRALSATLRTLIHVVSHKHIAVATQPLVV